MTRIRTHVNPLSITHRFDELHFDDIVTNDSKDIAFEIGFGRGVFLNHWARRHASSFYIGVEVRKPIVKEVKKKVNQNQLSNVALFHGNAELFLEDVIPDQSLSHVFVFHPDPWFKKRHHKRRVINVDSLQLIYSKLKRHGKLYISTDVDLLWHDICDAMSLTAFERLDFDPFWDNDYLSHWTNFSLKDERTLCYCTFVKR